MNDSLHQAADLSNIIGFRQRDMMRQNQLHALRLQIQQAEEAAKHAGKMEGHAARLQEIELQKLKVEQDRLTWQMEQEGLKGEKAIELREMRKLLSRAIGLLEVYRNKCPNPEAEADTASSQENIIKLTMFVAELEGIAIFLSARDPFHELGDIQTFDKFRFSLADFVSALSASGEIIDEPFKFLDDALSKRLGTMQEMLAFMGECQNPSRRLLAKPLLAHTNEESTSIRMESHQLSMTMAARFQSFVLPLSNAIALLHLDPYQGIMKQLSLCFTGFAEYNAVLEAAGMNEEEFLECAKGRGPVYSELATGLRAFRTFSLARTNAIARAYFELESIDAQFEAGNYRTGISLYEKLPQGIESCPSYKERGFVDYESVTAQAAEWRNCITVLEQKWEAAVEAYSSRIESAATNRLSWLCVIHTCENEPSFVQPLKELEAIKPHLMEQPDCEYRRDALALLERVNAEHAAMRRELITLRNDRLKTVFTSFSVWYHTIIIIVLIVSLSVLWLRRDMEGKSWVKAVAYVAGIELFFLAWKMMKKGQ